jgi:hypothetical protein
MWDTVLGGDFDHKQVLDDAERKRYLRDAMGLRFIPTTEYIKPYSGGPANVNHRDTRALLAEIERRHDQRADLITTATAERVFESEGVLDDYGGRTKHYGNIKGSNEFAASRVGAVIGSRHFGDDYVQTWGAFADETVTVPDRSDPENQGAGLSYGGDGFGDDVLAHMREHETLQAALRFGRDGGGATVYLHTDTLPEWVPVAGRGRVLSTYDKSSSMIQTIKAAIHADDPFTKHDVLDHDEVTVGERTVKRRLRDLAATDLLDREVQGGSAATLYRLNPGAITDVKREGEVNLDGEDEFAGQHSYWEPNRGAVPQTRCPPSEPVDNSDSETDDGDSESVDHPDRSVDGDDPSSVTCDGSPDPEDKYPSELTSRVV